MKPLSQRQKKIALLFLTGIALFACQKIGDYIKFPWKGDTDIKACAIKDIRVINSYNGINDTLQYVFSYNNLGNPVSVINNHVGTGNPNSFFKYDRFNRLTNFIRAYDNGDFENWDKYGYNSKNQAIFDTTINFGIVTDSGPLPFEEHSVITYRRFEYDLLNRIVGQTDSSVSHYSPVAVPKHYSYQYDGKGNLIQYYSTTYDNKVSLLRTNKIWMLISKNYSVNNPFVATQYNLNGLPTKTPIAPAFEFINLLAPDAFGSGNVEINYMCQ